ncbi:NAD-dependent epimerase/dehydratase family protein [Pedobacter sp. SL55]|uniref:NAD-dependent epimerase/dehydratase family protein n=1 Tax=Pedobacter sp. SL55 TaxID=2995161 RepID=UPI00226F3285|nr:NAD-dependent epimerase/dehydratase family protein [Pedobacter sp. SL55]WAC41445.1 NAD-dependent epimerase/dehydratase family protein [Pedobacter sp. SL55]
MSLLIAKESFGGSVNKLEMNLTITGSSGFIGQNLLQYLKNYQVTELTRQQLNNPTIEQLSNSEAIIHLAGKAHDLKKTSNLDEYYQVNFELTKKLYDAFLKSDAKKFIFISSVKASADSVNGILTEENEPNPQTDYGKSKLMAEQYIQAQELPVGKSYYILRPCMIHGPGNKGNLNLLYQFVQKGIPYPLATFENKRSFLSIENLCFVIQQLLKKDIKSGVYNVADDEVLSTNDVVKILAQASHKKAKLWKIPSTFIKKLANVGDVLRLPLNSERLQKLTESYVVSNAKIKAALQISLPVNTAEGLMITAKSFSTPTLGPK